MASCVHLLRNGYTPWFFRAYLEIQEADTSDADDVFEGTIRIFIPRPDLG